MKCEHCGAEWAESMDFCPNCGGQPVKISKKQPPAAVRVLLVLLSIVLSVALIGSLLTTVLILDYRQVTDKRSIEKAVGQLFQEPVRVRRMLPVAAAAGAAELAEEAGQLEGQTPEAIADFLFDSLKSQYGDEFSITREQVQRFVEESSVGDYVKDKVVSFADDFIHGTRNTAITPEELRSLLADNATLIESSFGVSVTEETLDIVAGYVADMKLDAVIRSEVIDNLEKLTIVGGENPDPENSAQGGYTLGNLMADLRTYTSNMALAASIAVNVLLIVILFFTNRMRIPGTLVCTGIPMVIVGALLSLPTALAQSVLSGTTGAVSALGALVGAVAWIHYATLGLGIALLIAAGVVKAVLTKK